MRLSKYLTEKFLNTYRWELIPSTGIMQDTDVFVNPSRKDIRDAMGNEDQGRQDSVRFIADNKKKVVYVWGAFLGLHEDIWFHINKETGQNRKLYTDGELLVGVYTPRSGKAEFESRNYYSIQAWAKLKLSDWEWATRYIPSIEKELDKLSAIN
jgi:hypothetical protein